MHCVDATTGVTTTTVFATIVQGPSTTNSLGIRGENPEQKKKAVKCTAS